MRPIWQSGTSLPATANKVPVVSLIRGTACVSMFTCTTENHMIMYYYREGCKIVILLAHLYWNKLDQGAVHSLDYTCKYQLPLCGSTAKTFTRVRWCGYSTIRNLMSLHLLGVASIVSRRVTKSWCSTASEKPYYLQYIPLLNYFSCQINYDIVHAFF